MKTEPNRKQKSSEITKKQIIHQLDNQTLKWLKTAFIILSASISNTKHFSTNIHICDHDFLHASASNFLIPRWITVRCHNSTQSIL